MSIRHFAGPMRTGWLVLGVLCGALACSSKQDSSGNSGGSNGSGGATTASGGATTQSGGSGQGGASAAGGAVSAGGNTNGGSNAATGGSSQGGAATATGGSGSATGGAGGAVAAGPCKVPTTATPAGTAPIQEAAAAIASTATRPQLEQALVDDQYTIAKYMAQAGTVAATFMSSGASASTVDAPMVDNWDPLANGIGDASTFTAMFTVAADGSGTHTTVQAAITAAAAVATTSCARVYVEVKAGTYREVVAVPKAAPPITLYSTETDASKTVIVFNNASGTMPAGGTATLGTSGSATFTQNAAAFQVKNLTFANDFVEGTFNGTGEQAVAFMNQGDKLQVENVRFLANQDTLYLKSVNAGTIARAYLRDSYIEGDTDFIFGRGTSVFDHCEVKTVGTSKTSGTCAAAPSTELTNKYGFLFISSKFTADTNVTGAFLARQWFESSRETAVGKMVVRNSTIGAHMPAAAPWKAWGSRTSPKNPASAATLILYTSDDYYATGGPSPAEPYIAEYGNN